MNTEEQAEYYIEDLVKEAKHYARKFFDHKKLDKSITLQDSDVDRIIELDICNGIKLIYDQLEQDKCEDGVVPEYISYALKLYDECAKLDIPKCFATGIILIYLENTSEGT